MQELQTFYIQNCLKAVAETFRMVMRYFNSIR